MRDSRLRVALWVGSSYGALVFGGTISLLHLFYNRLSSFQDAIVLWLFLGLLFGIPCALVCGGLTAGRILVDRKEHRNKADTGLDTALAGPLTCALALFHSGFFVPFFLYGLTYDQLPLEALRNRSGMLLFLGLSSALIVTAAGFLSRRIALFLGARLAAGSCKRGLRLGFAIVAAGHLVLALTFKLLPSPSPPSASPYRPLREGAGARGRVVFVGLDGADWRVAKPLIESGELPVFEKLIAEGVAGDLATLGGSNSAVIWASIYTGRRPREHGVLDFYRIRLPGMAGPGVFPVHRTYFKEAADLLEPLGLSRRRIADRSFLRHRPIWETLDDLGLSVGVVDGYYFSVPARGQENGQSFLYSYALNATSRRKGWQPRSLSDVETALLVNPPKMIRHYLPYAGSEDFDWQSGTLLEVLEEESQPDFLQLYTHQPDSAQHSYWKWHAPDLFLGVDSRELAENGPEIARIYRDVDRFLGALLARLEPDTTLIVASDHGHSPTLTHKLYTQHRHGPPGVILMWGPRIEPGAELIAPHIYDLAPTLHHLLGLPVASDMAGRVLLEALKEGDPSDVRQIDSYDAFDPGFEDQGPSLELNEEELERLRTLGYV